MNLVNKYNETQEHLKKYKMGLHVKRGSGKQDKMFYLQCYDKCGRPIWDFEDMARMYNVPLRTFVLWAVSDHAVTTVPRDPRIYYGSHASALQAINGLELLIDLHAEPNPEVNDEPSQVVQSQGSTADQYEYTS